MQNATCCSEHTTTISCHVCNLAPIDDEIVFLQVRPAHLSGRQVPSETRSSEMVYIHTYIHILPHYLIQRPHRETMSSFIFVRGLIEQRTMENTGRQLFQSGKEKLSLHVLIMTRTLLGHVTTLSHEIVKIEENKSLLTSQLILHQNFFFPTFSLLLVFSVFIYDDG